MRRERPIYWRTNVSLADWLIHRLNHSAQDFVVWLVLHVGVLDAEEDGGLLFWRWDPWNGVMKAN
jgi:hypothetical protein